MTLSIQIIGNSQADSDADSDEIVEGFDKLTYVNFTGEPKGVLIKHLMEFRNSMEDYNDEEEEEGESSSNSVDTKYISEPLTTAVFFRLFFITLFIESIFHCKGKDGTCRFFNFQPSNEPLGMNSNRIFCEYFFLRNLFFRCQLY